jgi:hypothetical protein
METIEIKTLIDITNTKVSRANQGSTFEFDQFKNFTTLMQCIGLRCIITYDENPQVEEVDLKNLGFATDKWYHYKKDGHYAWAKLLIEHIENHDIIRKR